MLRLYAFLLCWPLAAPALAQEATATSRAATGGAQTLDDILRRQEGQEVDDSFRSDVTGESRCGRADHRSTWARWAAHLTLICGGHSAMALPILRRKAAAQRRRP